jgi:aminomethyltransferase
MSELLQTALHDRHKASGAQMVAFSGWEMPIQYPTGILEEHLATRKAAGLFDVSHMGRFWFRGKESIGFLQHVLTNNAEALDTTDRGAQYTFLPNGTGGAVDDAYLYHFLEKEYLLVVNAANRQKAWDHLQPFREGFRDLELTDRTQELVMLSLQGPASRAMLEKIVERDPMPEPVRNAVGMTEIAGHRVMLARTGYTGEPVCFEMFMSREAGPVVWDQLVGQGATPVGLGARDTLRLEAGLPLYGHELGQDLEGNEIPILACPLARIAVSFSPRKGDFVGRPALAEQFEAWNRFMNGDYSLISRLPRMIRSVAVTGRGVARQGAPVFRGDKQVGYITSGTMVPFWRWEGRGPAAVPSEEHQLRSIALAYLEADIPDLAPLGVEIRGKKVEALVVPYHARSEAPPYLRPIHHSQIRLQPESAPDKGPEKVRELLEDTWANTRWRQRECINLIPSEMTVSPMARLLSIMDPAFRYAEHRRLKAFGDLDVFYYQGTDFIAQVERLLEKEMRTFLGCDQVETRLISGQMANVAVFSAMVDYVNRSDRKREPRRIRQVMNHHIGKGGHLSSQPMGALRDFVARDPRTERPAVLHFPVTPHNPYQVDLPATLEMIAHHEPELIIFGKSLVLHKEPVAGVRRFVEEQGMDSVILYDMAHVLGLAGPFFQEPFSEGVDLVTGSTHKTFFGTQRGLIAGCFREDEDRYALWESVNHRTFPGSVSNHHLGTMLGLLMAAYEMNHFKEDYQRNVIDNAKAFARALKENGLDVAGDPSIDFTETHQVVLEVGYGRGSEMAQRLEGNNIICNYQATPGEEGFTASGALRMGVAEMTRFGMGPKDFSFLASLIRDVVIENANVKDPVKSLRGRFCELQFCFRKEEYRDILNQLLSFL